MNLKKQQNYAAGALAFSLGLAAAGVGLVYGGFGGMLIGLGISWGIFSGIDLIRLTRLEEKDAKTPPPLNWDNPKHRPPSTPIV